MSLLISLEYSTNKIFSLSVFMGMPVTGGHTPHSQHLWEFCMVERVQQRPCPHRTTGNRSKAGLLPTGKVIFLIMSHKLNLNLNEFILWMLNNCYISWASVPWKTLRTANSTIRRQAEATWKPTSTLTRARRCSRSAWPLPSLSALSHLGPCTTKSVAPRYVRHHANFICDRSELLI